MTHTALTTYRVQMRCTIRSAANPRAPIVARLGPTKDDKPRLIQGFEQTPGWIEWVENGECMGYIKRGALRELQE